MSNKIIKDTIALTVITLVAGVALGGVYEITKEPIARQEALAKEKAYQEVFEDASEFQSVAVTPELEKNLREQLDGSGCRAQTVEEIMEAMDGSGNFLGYAFTIVSKEGYGGDIRFSMGIQADGTVKGLSILSISETAGLGMNADTPEFKKQFANKNTDRFVYTKNGASGEGEIDALSGATVTTNAMTNGANAGLVAFQIMEGGEQ